MNNLINICKESTESLTLYVMNTQDLYDIRHNLKESTTAINNRFIYTIDQLKDLQDYLVTDFIEINQ